MRKRRRGPDAGSRLLSRRRFLVGLAAATTGTGLVTASAYDVADVKRFVQATVTSDANGILGFTGYDDTSTTPTFTNNSTYSMSITLDSSESVEFDVGTDGAYAVPPVTFSLASGASKDVAIQFTGECADAGSAVVSTETPLDDGGETVGSVSFTREWKIPASGQVQFSGTASSSGNSGKYEFELENTGCEDVTFVGIGIKQTTTDAEFVSGGGSLIDANGTELVTDSIPVDSSNPDSDTRRDFNQDVVLSVNGTATWEFDKFQRSEQGNPNVDMQGEDVKIRLYLSDGSTKTEQLCLGSCDF